MAMTTMTTTMMVMMPMLVPTMTVTMTLTATSKVALRRMMIVVVMLRMAAAHLFRQLRHGARLQVFVSPGVETASGQAVHQAVGTLGVLADHGHLGVCAQR